MSSDTRHTTMYEGLLDSAARLSFDLRNADCGDAADNASFYGMTPEWSPIFGTPTWDGLSETERKRITRYEVSNYLGVGIWLEVGLQVALLRRHHSVDPMRPDVKFLFNECADENMHSLMFVEALESLGVKYYRLDRSMAFLGWLFRSFAWDEVAYGIVLVGEEMFDVMQRDWMVDDRVAEPIRRTSYVHVVEESRHMAFAREKLRERLFRAGRFRRLITMLIIAVGAHLIAKGLINARLYRDAGMDWTVVRQDIDRNEHHRLMFRRAAEPMIQFLDKEGLLNSTTRWIYSKSNLL